MEEFDPWGRPGAGAPMRNRQGQVMQLGRGCGVDMATLMKAKDVERKVDHRQKYGENHVSAFHVFFCAAILLTHVL